MTPRNRETTAPLPSQVVICGKGRIAASALSFTVHHVASQGLGCRVIACPNADDKGYDTWQESLSRAAGLLEVETIALDAVQDVADLLLVSLEYDRIIRVDRFRSRRLFNIHFSALPKYRGVFTSIWPLLNGESQAGVSLHFMDAGADTGDVIDQLHFALAEYTTARQLYDLYLDTGLTLFRTWLPRLLTTVPIGVPQDNAAATSYNRRSLDLRVLEVPFEADADTVCTFVRAFTFPEYQRPTVGGRAVRSCARLPATTAASPGTVLHRTAYSSAVATGGNAVVEIIWA